MTAMKDDFYHGGLTDDEVRKSREKYGVNLLTPPKRPSLWKLYLEKFEEKPRNLILSRRVGAYSNSMEEIVADMQFEYLREKAESGESFVAVGRCAETVLRDYPGLVSIFVTGDKEAKLASVKEHFGLDDAEAKAKMKRHDMKRKMYHNRHSDFKWGDSRHYDICINSSKLGKEKTAEMLEEYIKQRMQ